MELVAPGDQNEYSISTCQIHLFAVVTTIIIVIVVIAVVVVFFIIISVRCYFDRSALPIECLEDFSFPVTVFVIYFHVCVSL